MLDALLRNKNLSLFAIIAVGFFIYSEYQDAEKTKLEIELLKKQVGETKGIGDHNKHRSI